MPPLTLPRASNRSTDQLPTVSSFQFHVGNEDKKVVTWTVEEEEQEEEPSIPGLVDRLFRFDWLTGRTDGRSHCLNEFLVLTCAKKEEVVEWGGH